MRCCASPRIRAPRGNRSSARAAKRACSARPRARRSRRAPGRARNGSRLRGARARDPRRRRGLKSWAALYHEADAPPTLDVAETASGSDPAGARLLDKSIARRETGNVRFVDEGALGRGCRPGVAEGVGQGRPSCDGLSSAPDRAGALAIKANLRPRLTPMRQIGGARTWRFAGCGQVRQLWRVRYWREPRPDQRRLRPRNAATRPKGSKPGSTGSSRSRSTTASRRASSTGVRDGASSTLGAVARPRAGGIAGRGRGLRRPHISPSRVKQGKSMMIAYAEPLERIEARFGVPGPVLVAIWGLETEYGAALGKYSTSARSRRWPTTAAGARSTRRSSSTR